MCSKRSGGHCPPDLLVGEISCLGAKATETSYKAQKTGTEQYERRRFRNRTDGTRVVEPGVTAIHLINAERKSV
jgi:hypothetical protein